MKHLKQAYLLVFSAVAIIVFSISSCKKSNVQSGEIDITGTWSLGNEVKYSYKFNADSTVVYSKSIYDATGKFMFVSYTREGKYRFTPKEISLYGLVTFVNQDLLDHNAKQTTTRFVQTGTPNMVVTNGPATISFPIIVNADSRSFTIDYPMCNQPNVDCGIVVGEFKKQ